MERTVTEHEIKGEYNFIREITKTYVTLNGEERLWDNHRAPQCLPGKLDGETYVKHNLNDLSDDVHALASHFWTADVHASYEEFLLKQAAEQNIT